MDTIYLFSLAPSVILAACLQAMLSPEIQLEMDEFRREEREAKAETKAEKARTKAYKSSKSAKAKKNQRSAVVRPRRPGL